MPTLRPSSATRGRTPTSRWTCSPSRTRSTTSSSTPDWQAAKGPDIMRLEYRILAKYASQKAAVDLSPYLDPNYGQALTQLYWSAANYGGKPFLLPHHADTLAVIYNKDYMQKLGIEPPKSLDKAWTWQDFDTVARRLKAEAGAQYGLGVAWQGGNGQRWLYFLYQHGGQLLTDDLKSPAVNSQAGREAIAWCQKWFQDGIIPPNNSIKSPDPLQNLFAQGTVGMMVNGHWQIPFVNDQMKKYSWDVTFMPQDAAKATEFGGTGLAVSKDSKNPDVAADFMKFVVNEENMLNFVLPAQHLPVRTSLAAKQLNYPVRPEVMPTFIQQMTTVPEQLMQISTQPSSAQIFQVLSDQLELAFTAGQAPDVTAKNIEDGIRPILAG